jgi:hypothetical protein
VHRLFLLCWLGQFLSGTWLQSGVLGVTVRSSVTSFCGALLVLQRDFSSSHSPASGEWVGVRGFSVPIRPHPSPLPKGEGTGRCPGAVWKSRCGTWRVFPRIKSPQELRIDSAKFRSTSLFFGFRRADYGFTVQNQGAILIGTGGS